MPTAQPQKQVTTKPQREQIHDPESLKMERFFTLLFGSIQVLCIVLFLVCTTYKTDYETDVYSQSEYMIFRDIMVMLLLGFGYLMTFLKMYGLGAVGFTMLLTALAIELNLFLEPLMKYAYKNTSIEYPIELSIPSLIDGEFAAATLLISFGAVIGRVTPFQLLIMAIFQAFFYAINKVMIVFGTPLMGAEDVGGTITIHLFGAYFGLAASKALGPEKNWSNENNSSNVVSDVLSLIGTTLLWVYWPSFVGATETSHPIYMNRCVIHTVLSLIGSTSATFFMTKVLTLQFHPVHIANSTLAGGVAIGASARLALSPGGAFIVGVIVGCVSVVGYDRISPLMEEYMLLFDTCGVHNLHGLPALIGGLASAVFVTIDSEAEFLSMSKGTQAAHQVYAVLATLVLSLASGYFTGWTMKLLVKDTPEEYNDAAWWVGDYFNEVAYFPSDKSGTKSNSRFTRGSVLDRSNRSSIHGLDRSQRSNKSSIHALDRSQRSTRSSVAPLDV